MSLSSLNQAVNNLQKDFDIASYNFFLFTEFYVLFLRLTTELIPPLRISKVYC